MTSEQWKLIAGLIDEWWPGRFEREQEDAWFVVLEAYDAQPVADALKALLLAGGTHRPPLSELLAGLHGDPDAPTFEDALAFIVGQDGVVHPTASKVADRRARIAACDRRGELGCDELGLIDDVESNSTYPCPCRTPLGQPGEEELLERADAAHPLIGGFVRQQTILRLRDLGLDDRANEYREARRHELRGEWERFTEKAERQGIAALTRGSRRGELGNFDPAGALGVSADMTGGQ